VLQLCCSVLQGHLRMSHDEESLARGIELFDAVCCSCVAVVLQRVAVVLQCVAVSSNDESL